MDEPNINRTPEELLRLKHALGKSIPWGKSDLNALEIEELTSLNREDYVKIRKDYAEWQPLTQKLYFLFSVLVLCIAGYFLTANAGGHIVAVAMGAACVIAIGKSAGHAEGYIDGYDAGHEAGIYKILGVKNEEVGEMAEMATQMKIDDMVVERMDEREAKEGESKP